MLCFGSTNRWPGGQAAKTPPFHGGNTGSIPVRVTKKRSRCESICFFFLHRHAQNRESKKAVLNDSCRNAVCPQNYKTEQKSSYWVQGRPARDDQSALRAASDSRPGHHKEKADARASAFSFFDYYFYYQKGMFNFFFI